MVFRISCIWHIGWWNLITSVRLIQVSNNRNYHFRYFLGVRVRLIKVSFLKYIREINLGTSAIVRLIEVIEGVRLIRCPLNTGFTVLISVLININCCVLEVVWAFNSLVKFRNNNSQIPVSCKVF